MPSVPPKNKILSIIAKDSLKLKFEIFSYHAISNKN